MKESSFTRFGEALKDVAKDLSAILTDGLVSPSERHSKDGDYVQVTIKMPRQTAEKVQAALGMIGSDATLEQFTLDSVRKRVDAIHQHNSEVNHRGSPLSGKTLREAKRHYAEHFDPGMPG